MMNNSYISYNLMIKFLQKIILCFGISALSFTYVNLNPTIFYYVYRNLNTIMILHFIMVYLITSNLSFELIHKYSLIFQFLMVLFSIMFGINLWMVASFFFINIFYNLGVMFALIFLAFILYYIDGRILYVNTASAVMRHLFFISIISINTRNPILDMIFSCLYIICIFIFMNYYFNYINNAERYFIDDNKIDVLSDFLLIEILILSQFLFLNLCKVL